METLPPYLLVIDLEATCDDQGSVPAKLMETIEIGAVLVETTTLKVIDEFQTFIKPVRTKSLTPFCTQLTSITQAHVDNAPLFPVAIKKLATFIGERNALFCSWGNYDNQQFANDARFHGIELPFHGRHLNLKNQFSLQLGESKRYGMASALRRVGLPLQGTHHRGIDDARNIAALLPWVLGRRKDLAERAGKAYTAPSHG